MHAIRARMLKSGALIEKKAPLQALVRIA